jgi:sigma-54-dependent transcriptional regulator
VILCEGSLITPEHLSLPADAPSPPAAEGPPQTSDLHAIERDMIARVLRECNGNKSKAAKQLGLSRTQLYGRMRRYNVG